jgi:thiamine monophosphate kinase
MRSLIIPALLAAATVSASEPVVGFSADAMSKAEGRSFSVKIVSGALAQGTLIPVQVAVVGGTATKNSDYRLAAATGALVDWTGVGGSAHVWVTTSKDRKVEGDETIVLEIKPGAGYTVNPAAKTITLTIPANKT